MTKRIAPSLALLALIGAGAAAPAGASAASCGFGAAGKMENGDTAYLTAITKRKNVSCSAAKKAAKNVGDNKLCSKKTTHNGWTVRNIAPDFLVARFSKGTKSFVVTSQGAC